MEITVIDDNPPIAVCDQFTVVSLTFDGIGKIFVTSSIRHSPRFRIKFLFTIRDFSNIFNNRFSTFFKFLQKKEKRKFRIQKTFQKSWQ